MYYWFHIATIEKTVTNWTEFLEEEVMDILVIRLPSTVSYETVIKRISDVMMYVDSVVPQFKPSGVENSIHSWLLARKAAVDERRRTNAINTMRQMMEEDKIPTVPKEIMSKIQGLV